MIFANYVLSHLYSLVKFCWQAWWDYFSKAHLFQSFLFSWTILSTTFVRSVIFTKLTLLHVVIRYSLIQFCQPAWWDFIRFVTFSKCVLFHTFWGVQYIFIHSHLFYHSLKVVGWHPKTHFNRSKFSTAVRFNSFKTLI